MSPSVLVKLFCAVSSHENRFHLICLFLMLPQLTFKVSAVFSWRSQKLESLTTSTVLYRLSSTDVNFFFQLFSRSKWERKLLFSSIRGFIRMEVLVRLLTTISRFIWNWNQSILEEARCVVFCTCDLLAIWRVFPTTFTKNCILLLHEVNKQKFSPLGAKSYCSRFGCYLNVKWKCLQNYSFFDHHLFGIEERLWYVLSLMKICHTSWKCSQKLSIQYHFGDSRAHSFF